MAEQWLPVLSQVIQNLSAGFQNLSPWLQNAIVIFGVLSVAISALLMFVLPLITGVLSLISLFAMLPAAFVAAIPPVLAVVAAVAALVAIGVLVYQKWDEISAFLQKAWTKIKEVAVAAWNGLLAFLKEWWQAILLGVITGGMGLIISVIVKNWDKIKALGIQAWNRIKESIGGIFTSLIEVLRSKAEALPGMISNAFGRILEFLKSMLSKMMDMGKKLMQALKEGIGNVEIPLPTFSIDFREIFPGVRVPTLDIGVKWRSLSDLVPFLEEGGIVTGPTLAMIGEGSESEAILPLSKLDHMLGSRSIHLTIEMDGETLAEKTLPHMEDQIRLQTGVTY